MNTAESLPAAVSSLPAPNSGEQSAFLQNILESSTEYSIIGKDLEGKILFWNEGAHRLYGYEAEEVVGKANSSILHAPEDVKSGRSREIMEAALREGKWEGTLLRTRKSGAQFTARVVITPRRDPRGKPIGFLLISKDISSEIRPTEDLRATQHYARSLIEPSLDPQVTIGPECKITDVKRIEQMMPETNRMKSEFLANMSHELRAPLNGIIGFTELLIDEKPGPLQPRQKEYLSDVLTSARQLLQLINDVLDLAKVEAGKMELHLETFSVSKAVAEVSAMVKGIAQQKQIRLGTNVTEGLESVTLDQHKLKRVLYNLLSDALTLTDEGGYVHVEARRSDDRLEVRVRGGPSIKPEASGRLSVDFEQLNSGPARCFEGTDHGLALAKKIVEFQGGVINVESVPGKGRILTVVLPLLGGEQK